MEWINVKDRLPTANVLVKVLLVNDVEAVDFINEPFDASGPFQHYHAKAWRELTRDELNDIVSTIVAYGSD